MKKRRFKSQKGQSFVEYALILVAVLIFGALLLVLLRNTGPALAETVRCVMHFAVSQEPFTVQDSQTSVPDMGGCAGILTGALGSGDQGGQ